MVVLVLGHGGGEHDACPVVSALGHQVHCYAADALPRVLLASGGVDVVVLDLAPAQEALRFLRRRDGDEEHIPVVCIAADRGVDAAATALRLGAIDIIGRPLQPANVGAALANAIEYAERLRPAEETAAAEATPHGLFGPSRAMREVLDLARRAGTSRCPVLVVGERGTGHEMVARTIHASSGGAAGGFVKFACGSLNDRELHQVLDGPFEQTVFFDDIGELPVEMQNHVTRQLADWMTGPRILAGALPGLPDAVERREVRRELVDALSVLRINLLPLRERREDIPLLAMRFLKEACLTGRVPAKTFSRPALTVLGAMPWPGNALQLGSLCERLAVAVPRGTILLEDLLHNVRLEAAVPLNLPREPLRTARERFEREYIVSTLQEHRGRMGPAARQLGIERTNLYRKMKQLRIRGSNPDV